MTTILILLGLAIYGTILFLLGVKYRDKVIAARDEDIAQLKAEREQFINLYHTEVNRLKSELSKYVGSAPTPPTT